ncbi:hypothetical protein D9758_001601 [Tetrapyrgos nigripes]|uniref:Uncharacterized protein n=1 Tax=Tetrapyrgos nigripes TaxID=182062 RepID=A0A8H5GXX4_9AGAR|nr:hypothetical protein D9758_001601 [Tetrapyrgos nigripes]
MPVSEEVARAAKNLRELNDDPGDIIYEYDKSTDAGKVWYYPATLEHDLQTGQEVVVPIRPVNLHEFFQTHHIQYPCCPCAADPRQPDRTPMVLAKGSNPDGQLFGEYYFGCRLFKTGCQFFIAPLAALIAKGIVFLKTDYPSKLSSTSVDFDLLILYSRKTKWISPGNGLLTSHPATIPLSSESSLTGALGDPPAARHRSSVASTPSKIKPVRDASIQKLSTAASTPTPASARSVAKILSSPVLGPGPSPIPSPQRLPTVTPDRRRQRAASRNANIEKWRSQVEGVDPFVDTANHEALGLAEVINEAHSPPDSRSPSSPNSTFTTSRSSHLAPLQQIRLCKEQRAWLGNHGKNKKQPSPKPEVIVIDDSSDDARPPKQKRKVVHASTAFKTTTFAPVASPSKPPLADPFSQSAAHPPPSRPRYNGRPANIRPLHGSTTQRVEGKKMMDGLSRGVGYTDTEVNSCYRKCGVCNKNFWYSKIGNHLNVCGKDGSGGDDDDDDDDAEGETDTDVQILE